MLSKWSLCLALWLLLIFPVISNANDKLFQVVTEYFEPYQIRAADGGLSGYSADVVKALFQVSGDKPSIEVLPWARAFDKARTTQNVMIFSIVRTELREDSFKWVVNLASEQLFVWGLKTKFPNKIPTFEGLRKNIIVLRRSTNPAQLFESKGFRSLLYVQDQKKHISMLYKKRADLLIGARKGVASRVNELGFNFEEMVPVMELKEFQRDLYIAFNKNTDPKIIKRIKDADTVLRNNGTYGKLKRKWNLL